MTSEANIQRAIVEALIWDGWLILRINQGARSEDGRYVRFAMWQALGIDQQDSGISDIIAIKDRRTAWFNPRRTMLAIEVKAPGKKANVTDNQQAFLDAITEHGGISIVADSLEDIQPYLDRAKVQ